MKKLVLCCLLSLMLPAAFAQGLLQIGPKVSVSSNSVKPGDLIVLSSQDAKDLSLAFKESKSTLAVGGFVRINLLALFIQPEVMVSTSKIQYQWEELVHDGDDAVRVEKFVNVDIPIVGGLKLGPLRLQGGPVYQMRFNSSSELVEIDQLGRRFRESNIDLRLGAGLDLGPVLLDVYYQMPFRESHDLVIINGDDYRLNTEKSQLVASLGFAF